MLFWISVILFVAAITATVIFVGCFVYHDAKSRTNRPVTWSLIALLIPNFLGLVAYLAAGRGRACRTGSSRSPR